ncbi:MAG TPA: class D sortase [Vicinamibacterales bacterium]|jgi:sortase A|nr:class D sortase [Vicinamibacterales bacterium]
MAKRTPDNAWGPLPPHASVPPSASGWRWLERLLLLVAVLSLGYYGYVTAEAYLYQAYETRELDAILQNAPPEATAPDPAPVGRRAEPPAGSALGRIDIPRLGVSAIIRAGSDSRTLRLAVGHIAGTAYPGEPGNVGLAGHRDTFFRKLRDIHSDDVIRVVTPGGTFNYRVARTRIVSPSDVWVLDPGSRPVLTLVTCYPFTYVGSAPQRFIVRAELEPPRQSATIAR